MTRIVSFGVLSVAVYLGMTTPFDLPAIVERMGDARVLVVGILAVAVMTNLLLRART